MTDKKKPNRRIAALGDAEPEEVFRKIFKEADEKIRPELRQRPKQQSNEKGGKRNARNKGDA